MHNGKKIEIDQQNEGPLKN